MREGRAFRADLPRRSPKAAKPTRHGTLWLVRNGPLWLVETRPETGLLGGMIGFPGDGWDGTDGTAPLEAAWQEVGQVRHTFTHFHLILTVLCAESAQNPSRGQYTRLVPASLPTLMRKAYDLANGAFSPR